MYLCSIKHKKSNETYKTDDYRLGYQEKNPRYLTCETDRQYAELASDIYNLMDEEMGFMDDFELKNACISLAL